MSEKPQAVELRIDVDVYRAAMTRAQSVGMSLASVAKAVLYAEAARVPSHIRPAEGRPPLREYGVSRTPLRFKLPKGPYHQASAAIQASGRTVVAAVEDGLRQYAADGIVPNPELPPIPPTPAPARTTYVGTVKNQMLAILGDHLDGLTDPEIQDRLASGAKLTSQPPRRRELVRAGLIVEDGARELGEGSTWAVYKITEKGQDFLATTKESA